MPDTGQRLAGALEVGAPDVPVVEVEDLRAAVATAARRTPVGGIVLLSPAAPSYGRFRSFEERGDEFARLARETAPGSP
jgi:UDP-N-acetylmuramoylalanine--D-glutamate ligase